MYKVDLERAKKPEIQLPTSFGHRKSKGIPKKNIYFCFIDYTKAFECVDYNKLWSILNKSGILLDHLTCLLRNMYAGREATVRTRHGTADWFKIGKGVHQDCILLSCLFNVHEEYTCKMSGWMNYRLESKFPGKISRTSDMQMKKVKKN